MPEREPGGADRDRTDDLRLAKPALSQLSYSPVDGRAEHPLDADAPWRKPAHIEANQRKR